ncbi:hypothetical protein [Microcoleus sp. herbarium12]|uniref:hypothetical protein n=1 Tax=Microcoleus sp. herbarium12 TaxID=3055437 RepID=UPI002FD25B70
MIKPCSQPLKTNPFTCHRDPATGRWTTVVTTNVQNASETDSSLKAKPAAENPGQVETSVSVSRAVSLPKKRPFSSLPPFKKLAKKSVVTLSR